MPANHSFHAALAFRLSTVEPAFTFPRPIDLCCLIHAAGVPMNSVVFQNHEGAPIASLIMSAPAAPARTCVFISMCFTAELFASRESEILLPDRPTEYSCRYDQAGDGFTIAFENQNGWRITVNLDDEAEGEWSAEKDGERIHGLAHGLTGDSCAA
jgi:hypothetical protein